MSNPDRESAYWLEAAEVDRHRPPFNRDLTVNGRVSSGPTQHRRRTRKPVAR